MLQDEQVSGRSIEYQCDSPGDITTLEDFNASNLIMVQTGSSQCSSLKGNSLDNKFIIGNTTVSAQVRLGSMAGRINLV
jgi:hypothetical protein